jgi:hypothetical protein
MTLGKIERFWKTILNDFLQRAQFDSFEEASDRVNFWIKYYNYKRPHQGIGGLCPADRFFEIQHALKTTLERGIEENVLELALRGQPRDPFYMVGRMGEQSVVIRAEKGKVKMLVDDQKEKQEKELVYDIRKDVHHESSQENAADVRSAAENNGRIVDLDGAAHDIGSVPGDGRELHIAGPVAESGDGGDADGAYTEEEAARRCAECPFNEANREKYHEPVRQACEAGRAFGDHPERQKANGIAKDVTYGESRQEGGDESEEESGSDHESALRPYDGIPSGQGFRGIP